jgi:hypothetical protein
MAKNSLGFARSALLGLCICLCSIGRLAAEPVTVFNKARLGSTDYGEMGYVDGSGTFISVVGQRILGAWVDVEFEPDRPKDLNQFTVQMLVPVEDSEEPTFRVEASHLIPVAPGKYRAIVSSKSFNGVVRPGRYSIETFGTNSRGQRVPLSGRLGDDSGFHFIVTSPH